MHILKFLKDENLINADITILQTVMAKYGIGVGEHDDGRRVFFSLGKGHLLFGGSLMLYEANGLIIQGEDILCVPARNIALGEHISHQDLMAEKNNYDMYYADDGFILNFYFANGEWTISTTRGIDVTHMVYPSHTDLTYKQIVDECLEAFKIENFWKSLNPKFSYTIGFRHPIDHVFFEGSAAPMRRVWFIQRVNKQTFEVLQTPHIDMPTQCVAHMTLDDIPYACANAKKNFLIKGAAPFYGVIMRSKTDTLPDIIFRSSLMSYLLRTIYNRTWVRELKPHKMEYTRWLCLNVIFGRDTNFVKMFPQYAAAYKLVHDQIAALIDTTVKDIHKKSASPAFPELCDICKKTKLANKVSVSNALYSFGNAISNRIIIYHKLI
jgi:hypothetical protein